jgi:hypothetical protein
MSSSSTREMVHVVVAAGMLQPLVGNANAYNWLSDMRRSDPVYLRLNRRVSSFPKHRRVRGHIHYYKNEILRMMDELIRST